MVSTTQGVASAPTSPVMGKQEEQAPKPGTLPVKEQLSKLQKDFQRLESTSMRHAAKWKKAQEMFHKVFELSSAGQKASGLFGARISSESSPEEISAIQNARVLELGKEDLSARTEAIDSLQVEQLAANLSELSGKLAALMTKALDPAEKISIDDVKTQLKAGVQSFGKLVESFDTLKASVESNLKEIEEQVKDYNAKVVPPEHVDSISHYSLASSQDIVKGIQERKELNEQRIKLHDRLAENWTKVLIAETVIEWQLERIETYANVYTPAQKLNSKMCGLKGEIENLKKHLRQEVPKCSDQKALNQLLEGDKKVHGKLCQKYAKNAEKGSSLRNPAEESIKYLKDEIGQGGKPLQSALEAIHVYDDKIKDAIAESRDQAITSLHDERKAQLNKLEIVWAELFKRLDVCDNQESMTYELQRLGYVLHDNNGKIPADSLYKSYIYGWQPKEDYVVSPWRPAVEKAPAEEAAGEESPAPAKEAAETTDEASESKEKAE